MKLFCKTNKDIKEYKEFYEKVQSIIKKRSIDKICKTCSLIKEGCCTDCEYLSSTGCKVKALTCSLWFCTKAYRRLTIGDLKELNNIYQQLKRKRWLKFRGSMKDSLKNKKELTEGLSNMPPQLLKLRGKKCQKYL